MDFDSMAKGAVMNFLIGYRAAEHDAAPEWNRGDFFGTTFGPRHEARRLKNSVWWRDAATTAASPGGAGKIKRPPARAASVLGLSR